MTRSEDGEVVRVITQWGEWTRVHYGFNLAENRLKFLKREQTVADDSFDVVFDKFDGNFVDTSSMWRSGGGEVPFDVTQLAVLLSCGVVLLNSCLQVIVATLEAGSVVAVDCDAVPAT